MPYPTRNKRLRDSGNRDRPMPTLFRLLVILGLITGAAYGAMFALATLVQPNIAEISVRIPPERLNR